MKSFLTLIVFVAVVLAAGLYLVGCAAPEPKIVKQEVRIEVPVACRGWSAGHVNSRPKNLIAESNLAMAA